MNRAVLPIGTVAICAAAAVVFALPQWQALLVFNREAIAAGELWRLVGGNLVHFSPPQLLMDGLAVFAAGTLLESRRRGEWLLLCLTAGLLVGAAVYVAAPQVLVYGGLSGIAVAACTYVCLDGLRGRGTYAWLCGAGLGLIGVKVALEWLGVARTDAEFTLVPASHAAGALAAIALFAILRCLGALRTGLVPRRGP